jgi:3-oxoacyl-[acyl-carrier protein] reductase
VLGSSKGLGRAIADELAAEGADLFLVARDDAVLQRTRAEIVGAHPVRVEALAADVTKDCALIAQTATDQLGGIDILVTNSGGPPGGPVVDLDLDAWDAAYRLLLRSAVALCQAVVPGMRERHWGRVINITSISVKQPVDGLGLSNSLRAAVTGMARTLANEVAADGVTVNNVLPGYTATDRLTELAAARAARFGTSPEAERGQWIAETPMGRLGDPKELASLVAYLVSERAAFLTGQSIAVDGGWIKSIF